MAETCHPYWLSFVLSFSFVCFLTTHRNPLNVRFDVRTRWQRKLPEGYTLGRDHGFVERPGVMSATLPALER